MRDYGRLLVEEWAVQGRPATERWVLNDGLRAASSLRAAAALVGHAFSVPRRSVALWHYSSMSAGLRGLPLPGVLFSLVARARGVTVVTVLHEPAYPWGPRGWRGRVQSATQWLALGPVVWGSAALVVTREDRARQVGRLLRRRRRSIRSLPVFATVPVAPYDDDGGGGEPPIPATSEPVIGVVAFSGDGARPDVVVEAVHRLSGRPRVLIIGSPGEHCPEAATWTGLAREAGMADRLAFTGVVSSAELSRALQSSTVVVFANDEGPSGRRTTIAATLAHQRPLVALDGPARWDDLCTAEAVCLVPPKVDDLSRTLAALVASPTERAALAERGHRFYEERMSLSMVARQLGAVVDEAVTTSAASTRRSSRSS